MQASGKIVCKGHFMLTNYFLESLRTNLKTTSCQPQLCLSQTTWSQVGSSEVRKSRKFPLQWESYANSSIKFEEKSI